MPDTYEAIQTHPVLVESKMAQFLNNLIGGVVAGVASASRALVLGASKETDVLTIQKTAYIAAGGTLTATVAAHAGRTIKLDTAAGSVVTLPAASGSGATFRFVVSALATSNSHIVKVANASDIIQGTLLTVDTDTAGTVTGWAAGAADDTITLNRSTTGSVKLGEYFELVDMATNTWVVRGVLSNTGSGATPFSATV
jgi:hypothetical protein